MAEKTKKTPAKKTQTSLKSVKKTAKKETIVSTKKQASKTKSQKVKVENPTISDNATAPVFEANVSEVVETTQTTSVKENKDDFASSYQDNKAPYNVFGWYIEAWLNFFNFSSRANRMEFFTFGVLNHIFMLALTFSAYFYKFCLDLLHGFALITIIPTFALLVRRFHDRNIRMFWAFIPIIFFISMMIFVYLGIIDGSILAFENFVYIDDIKMLLLICSFLGFALISGFASLIVTLLKGNEGANRYGEPPLKPKTSAVVSLWLLFILLISTLFGMGFVDGYTQTSNGASYAVSVPEESVAGTQYMDEEMMKVKGAQEIQKALEAYVKTSLESLKEPEFTTEPFDDVELPESLEFVAAENGVVSMVAKKADLADMLAMSGLNCDNNTCVFDGQKAFQKLPEGVDTSSVNVSVTHHAPDETGLIQTPASQEKAPDETAPVQKVEETTPVVTETK